MVPVNATPEAVTVTFPPLLNKLAFRLKEPAPLSLLSALKIMFSSLAMEVISALIVIAPVASKVSVVALSSVLAIGALTVMSYSPPVPV